MYLIGKETASLLTVNQLINIVVCHKQHTLHNIFVQIYGKYYDQILELRNDYIYLCVVLCKISGVEIREQYELSMLEYIAILKHAQDELEGEDYLEIVKGIYTQYNLNINQN